jgi:RNA 3'-terminal phosphate cyclase (ATP)
MTDLVKLDGSQGEGGGQILRSALALSLLTGRPFAITRIRANRPKPGLRPQHLQSVLAAARICGASVAGAEVGSEWLRFRPHELRPDHTYKFAIGTAGATTLVLQTICFPLARAPDATKIVITGGTHVPFAPCADYLDLVWRLAVSRLGFDIERFAIRHGFYPRGGGELAATILPSRPAATFDWLSRGSLIAITPISLVVGLPASIAARQGQQAERRLRQAGLEGLLDRPIIQTRQAGAPGTMLFLYLRFETGSAAFFALGERGKPAETVADQAVDECLGYLSSGDYPVDPYLADQLLVPIAAAGVAAQFSTSRVTEHLLTNAAVVSRFCERKIEIVGRVGQPAAVALKCRS